MLRSVYRRPLALQTLRSRCLSVKPIVLRRSLSKTAELQIIYDKQTIQPLVYTVASAMTMGMFTMFAATQSSTVEGSTTITNIVLSPFWTYLGIAIGALNLYGASKFPKFLISEVAVSGKKVFIRTHTMLGGKSPVQEVYDKSELVRIKNTSPEMVNWKLVSAPRRFTLSRTDEVEKLVPYGFGTSPASASPTLPSNIGAKSLAETQSFEKTLRERWNKRKTKT